MTYQYDLTREIKVRYGGVRRMMSIREICKQRNIPENVMQWRLSKGITSPHLFTCPTNLYPYEGELMTPKMISELSGIREDTIIKRWRNGERGSGLTNKTDNRDMEAERMADRRARLAAECAAHLQALINAHGRQEKGAA